jgi:hypothetical protein
MMKMNPQMPQHTDGSRFLILVPFLFIILLRTCISKAATAAAAAAAVTFLNMGNDNGQ